MTQYAPAERLPFLTFYGILIDEMSSWEKITAVPSKYGDFGAGDRKGTFFPAAT